MGMDAIRIILVDDDQDFREAVAKLLRHQGMDVSTCASASEMEEVFASHFVPHILILDVMLKGETAFDLLPKLRSDTNFGLILLTGQRKATEDRIEGLEKGADAYLTKPIDIRELTAVIQSLYGRLISAQAGPRTTWVLSKSTQNILSPGGQAQDLTHSEFTLLNILAEKSGEPVDRQTLCVALGRPPLGPDDRNLDVLVSRLRKKFSAADGDTLPLRSARNIGYIFYGDILVV